MQIFYKNSLFFYFICVCEKNALTLQSQSFLTPNHYIMKKYTFLLILLCNFINLFADPAWPDSVLVHQPDSTDLWAYDRGDEFFNWVESTDGFVIVRNQNRVFEYATVKECKIAPSGVKVHNVAEKDQAEIDYARSQVDIVWNRLKEKDITKIGQLYYRLDPKKKTAEIVFKRFYVFNAILLIGEDLVIPPYVKYNKVRYKVIGLGENAFPMQWGIKSVTIPKTVKHIADNAFNETGLLMEINVHKRNRFYSSKEGVLYDKKMERLICCPRSKTGHLTVPNSVADITPTAFKWCSLESIILPLQIKEIKSNFFTCCHRLNSITLPANLENIEIHAFDRYNSITEFIVPQGQKERFAQMEGLKEFSDRIIEK